MLQGLGTLRSQYPREEMDRFAQCVYMNFNEKGQKKIVRVMVEQEMVKVDEVEGGCW